MKGKGLGLLTAAAVALAAPAAGPAHAARGARMHGVCWEGAGRVERAHLEPLRDLGVDWISQTPFGWSRSVSSPEIRIATTRVLWGETDEGLAETARHARALGIRTLLKPHLWVRGAWVGDLKMTGEAEWKAWFRSYEAFILHYAELARRERFAALAVGTELRHAARREADWRRLIRSVRAVYPGKLTYCANWGEEEDVAFWDALDFVGVQAYYPLTDAPRPALAEIRSGWSPVTARLAALARRTGKPIVFTEVGYKSVSGSVAAPWKWELDGDVDLALQRDAYRAMFESVWGQPWFGGAFLWKWHPDPAARAASWHDPRPDRLLRDFTPQGKPALEVVREYYRRRGPTRD